MKSLQKGSVAFIFVIIIAVSALAFISYKFLTPTNKSESQNSSSEIKVEQSEDEATDTEKTPEKKVVKKSSGSNVFANLPPANFSGGLYDVTLNQVLNSRGFVDGVKNADNKNGNGVEKIILGKIAFGDVDGDGSRDAVVPVTSCRGSVCSNYILVYKNDHGKIISSVLSEDRDTSAYDAIVAIIIKANGVIAITKADTSSGSTQTTSEYQVKFVGEDLRVLDTETGLYVSQDVNNSNFGLVYPTGGEKFIVGSKVPIHWSASGLAKNTPVKIYIVSDNYISGGTVVNGVYVDTDNYVAGSIYTLIGSTTNTGTFEWTVPATPFEGGNGWPDTTGAPVYRLNIKFNQTGSGYLSPQFGLIQ